MDKKEIIEGILYLLRGTSPTFDGSGYTFLQIKEFLKTNNVEIKQLKELLKKMENEGLIEERHFDEKYNGRVDYSIEKNGINLIEKIKKELKAKGIILDNKWRIPDIN